VVQFFKAKKQSLSRKNRTQEKVSLESLEMSVDVIDHNGNGICLSHKPIIVVPASIPGELYRVQILSKKQKVWHGKIGKVLQGHESARVKEFCPYVSQCGGCSHQSFDADYLIEAKQTSLQSYLNKAIPLSRLENCDWQDVIKSNISEHHHGYRRRARIAIDARNSEEIKIGFRQEKSNKVVDIPKCAVLTDSLQSVYESLVSLIKRLPSASSIGHITLTEGAQRAQVCLHLTKNLSTESVQMLILEQQSSGTQYMIESKASKLLNVAALQIDDKTNDEAKSDVVNAGFTISDSPSLNLAVTANNFIQINQHVNEQMLKLAKDWLNPTPEDCVVDLFSGVGNFSLYLAPYCKEVIGVEGVAEMVQQATENARLNGIQNCRFEHYDLNDLALKATLNIPEGALFIVDPSRAGALEIMKVISVFKPQKILYVSCNPTSFARDVDALSSKFEITKARALDMFPFTKHIEMVALISSK
jgi:23S rRNA (uracil1939-C5)-methyltransferase